MKKLLLIFTVCIGIIGSAFAENDTFETIEYLDKSNAVVRIMNKAAGRATTATIPVGRAAEYEKLNILIRSCKETPPFERKDYFMFIEINKKTNDAARIFSGWMIANEPGENPLQDADYDIWLIRCE